MSIRRPSHATVVAYLALFCAIGGSAYAVSKVGTSDIKRSAVTSAKIDNKGVKKRDLATGSVAERALRDRLEPSQIVLAGTELPDCDPSSSVSVECGAVTAHLREPGKLLVIVSGGQYTEDYPASAICEIQVDGTRIGGTTDAPGEIATDNTDLSATNGFARTGVSQQLSPGRHEVALACSELGGDARVAGGTIAVLAIPGDE